MIQLAVFDGDTLIHDASHRARGGRVVHGKRGAESLTWRENLPFDEGLQWLQRALRGHTVKLSEGSLCHWRGRLEDVALREYEVEFTALGKWRDLMDAPYTALWSTESYGEWNETTEDDRGNRSPERYQIDNNNRLYIAPRKNENLDGTVAGAITFETPDKGQRNIARVEFDYEITDSKGSSWRADLNSYTRNWASANTEWTQSGSGSGSATVSLSTARDRIEFVFWYNATAADYTGETGETFMKITSLRVLTIDQASVETDDVAPALLTFADGINSGRVETGADFINSTGVDLTELVLEDEYPGDVLVGLADGDTAGTRYETGIRNLDGRVYLRERASAGRTWLVDLDLPDLLRSLDDLANSAYAVYRDENGITRRTANSADDDSVSRYGITRRIAVDSRTTSATKAGYDRDAALDGEPEPRALLGVSRVLTEYQGVARMWEVKSGDTLVARNLPPWLPAGLSQYLTSFVAARVEYDLDSNSLRVEPDVPPPSLAYEILKEKERAASLRSRAVIRLREKSL